MGGPVKAGHGLLEPAKQSFNDHLLPSLKNKIPYGIYHATNQGYTTWFDFTKEIFQLANISCRLKPVTTEEFPRPAKRPKNSQMSKDKILNAGIIVPEWKDALKRYLEVENI